MKDVRLLSLDAGNTIVFLDHDVCAAIISSVLDRLVTSAAVERAEGIAKRRLDEGALPPGLADEEMPPWWSAFMLSLVAIATGAGAAEGEASVRALWREHRRFNLWRKVPSGLAAAVAAVRRVGVPVCIVSNSEGRLAQLLARVGLGDSFDLVLDSHEVGVAKPDSRIFTLALSRFSVDANRALHVGDSFANDIAGARGAGMQAALVDPFGHYAGRHPDVDRVADVNAVCRAIVAPRGRHGETESLLE